MGKGEVQKGYHCAWQIHYHLVFPVKYRKVLLDEMVIKIIEEIKKELWGGEFWSDGYYVATVGERGNWSKVEKYIQRQGKPKEDLRQIKLF